MAEWQRFGCLDTWQCNCKQTPSLRFPIALLVVPFATKLVIFSSHSDRIIEIPEFDRSLKTRYGSIIKPIWIQKVAKEAQFYFKNVLFHVNCRQYKIRSLWNLPVAGPGRFFKVVVLIIKSIQKDIFFQKWVLLSNLTTVHCTVLCLRLISGDMHLIMLLSN